MYKITCQSKNYQVQKGFDLFFVFEIRVQRLFNSHAVEVRYCLGCRNEPVTKFVALKLLLESRKLAFALFKLAWTSQYGILYLYILFILFYSTKIIQKFSRTRWPYFGEREFFSNLEKEYLRKIFTLIILLINY